jgi:hypothetical protein
MKFLRASLLCLLAVSSALLPGGCVSGPGSSAAEKGGSNEGGAYTHYASGLVFPRQIGELERVSVTPDSPDKGCVAIYYTATKEHRLERSKLSFYLNAEVTIFPALCINAEQLLKSAEKSAAKFPDVKSEPYRGTTSFGSHGAVAAAQYSFDRPLWHDRSCAKTVLVREGRFLVRFELTCLADRAEAWQNEVDRFISQILANSTRPGISGQCPSSPLVAKSNSRQFDAALLEQSTCRIRCQSPEQPQPFPCPVVDRPDRF